MNLSFHIARRYLFGKKSHNIINIISGISTLGVCIGTMAMIIVMSVFNGFQDLISSLFSSFNPSILITATTGKHFTLDSTTQTNIKGIKGVVNYVDVLEENALIKYGDKQCIATMKGVDTSYLKMIRLDTMMLDGKYILHVKNRDFTVLGAGLAYNLGLSTQDIAKQITTYVPRTSSSQVSNPLTAFNTENIYLSGIFSIQQEIDIKYMIVPLAYARKVLELPKEVTSIEIGVSSQADLNQIKSQIQKTTGTNYIVKNRFEQEALLFKIMRSEKLIIFMILSFILLIAIINTIGSLTLLILDKQKDISILRSMGANNALIRNIFFIEGIMISIVGGILGILLGWLVCMAQQYWGFVKFPAGTFVVDSYPVIIHYTDFLITLSMVVIIGAVSIWLPIRRISAKYLP